MRRNQGQPSTYAAFSGEQGNPRSVNEAPGSSLLSPCHGLDFVMSAAPVTWRGAFPHLKGAKERVGVLVAQQVGDLIEFDTAVFEIVVRQFPSGMLHQLLKGNL